MFQLNNLYVVSFTGIYPVGAFATIAATSKENAKHLLLSNLTQGSAYRNYNIKLDEFKQIPGTFIGKSFCFIHSEGDY